jgi:hypothetical protein
MVYLLTIIIIVHLEYLCQYVNIAIYHITPSIIIIPYKEGVCQEGRKGKGEYRKGEERKD